MNHSTVPLALLYKNRGLDNKEQEPKLVTYILDNYSSFDSERKRPIVLICPGGAYSHLSDREAEPVAIKMNSLGFHAAVLKYSLAPMDFPCALLDLATAVAFIRENADKWNIDSSKIIVGGFSAGGHLAASLACNWNTGLIKEYLGYEPEQVKPNGILLCYPVITADPQFCNEPSVQNCLGSKFANRRDLFSQEAMVNKDVPPVFMWHTLEDESVPAENSLFFANALRKHKIPFEYHLFSTGIHGLSLGTAESSDESGRQVNSQISVWPELFVRWVNRTFGKSLLKK